MARASKIAFDNSFLKYKVDDANLVNFRRILISSGNLQVSSAIIQPALLPPEQASYTRHCLPQYPELLDTSNLV